MLITSFSNTFSNGVANNYNFTGFDIDSNPKKQETDATETSKPADEKNAYVLTVNEDVPTISVYLTSMKPESKDYQMLMLEVQRFDSLQSVRNRLVDIATDYIGIPYEWGGDDTDGWDCSAYVRHVYDLVGVELPRTTQEQAVLGEKIDLKEAKTGDLIFFGYRYGKSYKTKHIAIVMNNSPEHFEMIHCSKRGVVVDTGESNAWKKYYKKKMLFVKRLIM